MWVEAIFSQADLRELVEKFLPLTIHFGDEGSFVVSDPTEISLVKGAGLRVACRAKVHLPVLGIDIPVTIKALTILLRPVILKKESGDSLVFRIEIEHADLAGIPTIIDNQITHRVNKMLADKEVDMAWEFTKTLSYSFDLPATLAPINAMSIIAAWGEVRVSDDALALVVSFHNEVFRGDARPPSLPALAAAPAQPRPPRAAAPPVLSRADGTAALGWGIAALAAASALALFSGPGHRR